jgi:hypothetical protein
MLLLLLAPAVQQVQQVIVNTEVLLGWHMHIRLFITCNNPSTASYAIHATCGSTIKSCAPLTAYQIEQIGGQLRL